MMTLNWNELKLGPYVQDLGLYVSVALSDHSVLFAVGTDDEHPLQATDNVCDLHLLVGEAKLIEWNGGKPRDQIEAIRLASENMSKIRRAISTADIYGSPSAGRPRRIVD